MRLFFDCSLVCYYWDTWLHCGNVIMCCAGMLLTCTWIIKLKHDSSTSFCPIIQDELISDYYLSYMYFVIFTLGSWELMKGQCPRTTNWHAYSDNFMIVLASLWWLKWLQSFTEELCSWQGKLYSVISPSKTMDQYSKSWESSPTLCSIYNKWCCE